MRIVVSTPTFLPLVGGAELGIHELYNRIGRQHDVIVVTPRHSSRAIADYGADDYGDANYRVLHVGDILDRARPAAVGRAIKRTSLPYINALHDLAAERPIDVANFHFLSPQGAAMLYAHHRLRLPIAISLVGRADVVHRLSRPRRCYARLALSAADAILPISTYYRDGTEAHTTKTTIIPFGVDTQEFAPSRRSDRLRRELGLGPEHFMLLAVQRLAQVKRVDVLIRAMDEIRKQHPAAVLVVVGQGEEQARLRALTAELGLHDHVRFAGYVQSTSLAAFFASADVFVFHSMFETFGIVFAQAMASGLPIVAADTSCVPHVVTPENGILFPPGDLLAFTNAVLQLVHKPELRQNIGRLNRAKAQATFDWDFIAASYEAELVRIASTSGLEAQGL